MSPCHLYGSLTKRMTRTALAICDNSAIVPLRRGKSNLDGMSSLAANYPELRYMGSKTRLLPWVFETLNMLDFESAMDPFSGTGCVSYLMKAMGRRVIASDFLNFTSTVARATIENNHVH